MPIRANVTIAAQRSRRLMIGSVSVSICVNIASVRRQKKSKLNSRTN